jgi:prevent-host-death family protein
MARANSIDGARRSSVRLRRRQQMRSVGIRELRERASEILRDVSERGEEVSITRHGRVVAVLVPPREPEKGGAAGAAAWSELDRVAALIGAKWPAGLSAGEAVSEDRR